VQRHDVFPGRLAGALFSPESLPAVHRGFHGDPGVRAVRLDRLSPDGSGPGEFLVDLRSGRITRVQPSLARLVRRLHRDGFGPDSAQLFGPVPDLRVLAGLTQAGVLREDVA
jgi:hypothetical protein